MKIQKNCQEYIKELGAKIKLYRIMRGMSQQELADKTGISKRSISRLEQGESVHINSLFTILIALDLGDNIELLVPDQSKRPSFYLEKSENTSKRVRKRAEKRLLNGEMKNESHSGSVSLGDKNRNNPSGSRHPLCNI